MTFELEDGIKLIHNEQADSFIKIKSKSPTFQMLCISDSYGSFKSGASPCLHFYRTGNSFVSPCRMMNTNSPKDANERFVCNLNQYVRRDKEMECGRDIYQTRGQGLSRLGLEVFSNGPENIYLHQTK